MVHSTLAHVSAMNCDVGWILKSGTPANTPLANIRSSAFPRFTTPKVTSS